MAHRRRAPCAARSRAARAVSLGVAPRALFSALIALGLLLGQGSMLLHLLMVPHAPCEHGELIEVRATSRAAPSKDRSKQASVEAAAPGDGEHEHCDQLARPHRIDGVGPVVAEASFLSIEPRTTLGARSETRPVDLLSLAPKSSPPAA